MNNSFIESILSGNNKKPMPILTYPAMKFTGSNTAETLTDAEKCAALSTEAAAHTDCAAVFCVMDLSVEAEAFGAEITFENDSVPAVKDALITTPEQVRALAVPDVNAKRCPIFIDAVSRIKKAVTDKPVFAGCCAPFSLCSRLTGLTECMMMMYDEPEALQCLLEKCTEFLIKYIRAFQAAGADGVLLAEPVAGLISPALEREFSAPFTKRLADAVKRDGFTLIYHNCGASAEKMTDSLFDNGCDIYHFGEVADIVEILKKAPADKIISGNISPLDFFVNASPDEMTAKVKNLLTECKNYPNFVLSSGCDIPQNAKWENINAFFEAAKCR